MFRQKVRRQALRGLRDLHSLLGQAQVRLDVLERQIQRVLVELRRARRDLLRLVEAFFCYIIGVEFLFLLYK